MSSPPAYTTTKSYLSIPSEHHKSYPPYRPSTRNSPNDPIVSHRHSVSESYGNVAHTSDSDTQKQFDRSCNDNMISPNDITNNTEIRDSNSSTITDLDRDNTDRITASQPDNTLQDNHNNTTRDVKYVDGTIIDTKNTTHRASIIDNSHVHLSNLEASYINGSTFNNKPSSYHNAANETARIQQGQGSQFANRYI